MCVSVYVYVRLNVTFGKICSGDVEGSTLEDPFFGVG